MSSKPQREDQGFRIGAVARLTGISVDALRVWERRYQVTTPQRSDSGTRLYNQQDVARLQLIKQLVDAGQAIGTVASLGLSALQARVRQLDGPTPTAIPGQTTRLLLAGPTLPLRLAGDIASEDPAELQLCGSLSSLSALEQSNLQADVLVVECPTLDEHSASRLRRVWRQSAAQRLLVVYGFAPRDALAAVEAEKAIVMRFPVDWETLRHYCLAPRSNESTWLQQPNEDLLSTLARTSPPRRFDDTQLARAGLISTSIACECPHHLADLIISLSRFERYSAECESRNEQDAALHAYLHDTTARARAMMEGALQHLLELENLDVGDPA